MTVNNSKKGKKMAKNLIVMILMLMLMPISSFALLDHVPVVSVPHVPIVEPPVVVESPPLVDKNLKKYTIFCDYPTKYENGSFIEITQLQLIKLYKFDFAKNKYIVEQSSNFCEFSINLTSIFAIYLLTSTINSVESSNSEIFIVNINNNVISTY